MTLLIFIAPIAIVAAPAPQVIAPTIAAPEPQVVAPTVAYSYLPYALHYGYNSPVPAVLANHAIVSEPVAHAPVPVATPNVVAAPDPSTQTVLLTHSVPTTHQFHAQDELGQYQFGYTEPTASRVEQKSADGVITGRYNYVDTNGIIQTVSYIADALGFRVAGTNLPVHVPVPTAEAPDVIAAREAHAELVKEAQSVQAVEVAAQHKIISIPDVDVSVEGSGAGLEDSEYIAKKTFVVGEANLEPYVPPPTPQVYKAADPGKVAAAIEKNWGAVATPVLAQPASAAPVVVQPQVYVQQAPIPVASPPVITPHISAAQPPVHQVVVHPQAYVEQAPIPIASPPVITPQISVAQPPVHQVVVSPAVVPPYIGVNQHHAQDEYGQYQYGYSNDDSYKLEQRLLDGSVRGTYSYKDANSKY